jgi:two-component system chemotaxis response regulator CheB
MSPPSRDLIVIGGSAGGVEVLSTVLGVLPPDIGAAVAVTIHRHPTVPSSLVNVFARKSSLAVIEPRDGEAIKPGRVYLAPADRHMLIAGDVIRLNREPRQHHTRPAIDPLFTSAAESRQTRVIGLLVTGNLSDGVSGLIRIKELGGTTLVQDPRQALYPSMPRNALIYDNVDLIVTVQSVAPTLAALVRGTSVQSITENAGVRRPGSPPEQIPGWVARGHRLP